MQKQLRCIATMAVIFTAVWHSRAESPRFEVANKTGASFDVTNKTSARSPKWPAVRQSHLARHPACAACGAKATEADLEVHHIRPYHLDPSLELDPQNLITLCRSGRNCHLNVGHDPDGPGESQPNWKSENRNVQRDAAWLMSRMNPGIARGVSTSADSAPTPYAEVQRVIGLLPKPIRGFVDYGCGDGRWLLAAAERWPDVKIVGVEIDPARASATRERVRESGLSGRITVITGDATKDSIPDCDVGVAYLYGDVLARLVPRLKNIRSFASYIHKPAGIETVKNGDTWIYTRSVGRQAATPTAVWNGQLYTGRMCGNPNCGMCASIQNQLAAAQQQTAPVVEAPKAAGHWQRFRVCNGRSCWFEDRWVSE